MERINIDAWRLRRRYLLSMERGRMSALPTNSARANALTRVAAAVTGGHPCDSIAVHEGGVTIVANAVSAARWRDTFGDSLGDIPLTIFAATSLERDEP